MNFVLSIFIIQTFVVANGYSPSLLYLQSIQKSTTTTTFTTITTHQTSTTHLYAKSKKKQSMSERRKKRGQKFIPKPIARPAILDTIPNPDVWNPTTSTDEQVQEMKKMEEEVQSKATSLINTQRRSVEVLTYVKEKIQALETDKVVESLLSSGGLDKIFHNILGDELSTEMRMEALSMLENDKMELDLAAGLGSGEFAVAIKGGEEQYADVPRITEFVVSLTRHLTAMLNQSGSLDFVLDESASMASLRTFNRMARLSSFALLSGKDVNEITNEDMKSENRRPFQLVTDNKTGDDDEVDYRKVTIIYFLSPDGWNKDCGGGISIKYDNEKELYIDAVNDRLMILSSDRCLHRIEEWLGDNEGRDSASMLTIHLVAKNN